MPRHLVRHFVPAVIASVSVLATALPAAAGSAGCNCGLFPFLAKKGPAVAQPYHQPRPIYVVNQGPVYDGPGVTITSNYYTVGSAPQAYPYVSGDDVTYPYAYRSRGYGASSSPGPHTVIRARAEMRLVTPDQIDIRLYRED